MENKPITKTNSYKVLNSSDLLEGPVCHSGLKD